MKITYKCYLCEKEITRYGLHWKKYHSSEVSHEDYVSRLKFGLDSAPLCPYCGNVRKLTSDGFQQTCGSEECVHKLLSDKGFEKWESNEYRDKLSESQKRSWENPDSRENRINSLREVTSSQEYKQKMSEAVRKSYEENPDIRLKISESSKKMWESQEYRDKWSESMRKTMANPETRQHYSEANKIKWQDPLYRENKSQKTLEQWNNPEYRELMSKVASRTIQETLRKRLGSQSIRSTLYLILFEDSKEGNQHLVKCGVTGDFNNRLWNLECMGYKPLKILTFNSTQDKTFKAENNIHSNGFNHKKVEKRYNGMMANGYTEWYYATEFEAIKKFAEENLEVSWEEVLQT